MLPCFGPAIGSVCARHFFMFPCCLLHQSRSDQLRGQLTAVLCTARSFARSVPFIRRYLYHKILTPRRYAGSSAVMVCYFYLTLEG
jgi:hypothetical protein